MCRPLFTGLCSWPLVLMDHLQVDIINISLSSSWSHLNKHDFFRAHCEGTGERQRRRAVISPPGPGGFTCPPLLQQAVCPPCNPSPPSSSSPRFPSLDHLSPASSRTPKRLPLTLALAGGDDEMGQGPATVYVGPWSQCQSRHQDKRDPRDTRMREPGGSSRVTLPRSLPPLPGPPPASPHFPLPWLPASSPSPSGPSSPAPVLGERQRNVVCRSTFAKQVFYPSRSDITMKNADSYCRTSNGATTPFKECMDGSRATVVPADRGSCVVSRDCAVATWTAWTATDPQPCAAGPDCVIIIIL